MHAPMEPLPRGVPRTMSDPTPMHRVSAVSNWECSKCGKVMSDYVSEVGYDGPEDRGSQECHPFMAWEVLCRSCEEERRG